MKKPSRNYWNHSLASEKIYRYNFLQKPGAQHRVGLADLELTKPGLFEYVVAVGNFIRALSGEKHFEVAFPNQLGTHEKWCRCSPDEWIRLFYSEVDIIPLTGIFA